MNTNREGLGTRLGLLNASQVLLPADPLKPWSWNSEQIAHTSLCLTLACTAMDAEVFSAHTEGEMNARSRKEYNVKVLIGAFQNPPSTSDCPEF